MIARKEVPRREVKQTMIYGAPLMPVSGFLERENGTALKHLLGMPCKLIGGAAFVEDCEGPVTATIRLDMPSQTLSFDFALRKGFVSVHRPMDVEVGSRITLSVIAAKPEKLSGIWVTLVFTPKLPKEAMERFFLKKEEEDA